MNSHRLTETARGLADATSPHRPPTLPPRLARRAKRVTALHLGALALCFAAVMPALGQGVRLTTSAGDIVIELDRAKAPKTVDNFIEYVKSGHYDGTIFHRVIPNFMIQGGGFDSRMTQKPTRAPIPLESRNGLANVRGTVAMARTAIPDSATAQFFINVTDNAFLDQPNSRDGHGYAVFAKVTEGMDVVDKIRGMPTTNNGPHQNVPAEPVIIRKATLIEKK